MKGKNYFLDYCSVYNFFWDIYFFELFSNICMHVTDVTIYFLVASCWTRHAAHISIWRPDDTKNEVGMRKVRFLNISQLFCM